MQARGAQQRTFFVERLLKEVLFKESGFAGTNPRLERQKIVLQAASYAGVLLVCGVAVLRLRHQLWPQPQLSRPGADCARRIPGEGRPVRCDRPRRPISRWCWSGSRRCPACSDVAQQYKGDVPLSMRFGLYQGNAVGDEVRDAYFRELNGILLPGVASQFRAGLTANASRSAGAVLLPQGLPDAGRARASGPRPDGGPGRDRVAQGVPRRRRAAEGGGQAFRCAGCGSGSGCVRSRWTAIWWSRRATRCVPRISRR